MKIKTHLILMMFMNTLILLGQNSYESEVVISEENLISIIKKVRDKRNFNNSQPKSFPGSINNFYYLTNNEVASDVIDTSYIKKYKLQKIQLDEISERILAMNNEIKILNKLIERRLDIYPYGYVSKRDTVIVTSIEDKDKFKSKTKKDIVEKSDFKKDTIKSVVVKEVAYPIIVKDSTNTFNKKEYDALLNKYNQLVGSLIEKKSITDTIIVERRIVSDYQKLLKEFGNYKEQVFFENNSKEVLPKYNLLLDGLVEILLINGKIDVSLKGFTSKKGNPMYNQKLSFQRSENVKQFLIQKGVHPSRILTQYHGVDYGAESDEEARRVDVTLVVRK